MRSRILMLAAVLSTGAAAVLVAQSVKRLRVVLSGYEEPPAVSTVGTGTFEARIDNNEIRYTLRYDRLEGAVAQAHIHLGQRRVNGGISAWLCGNPPLNRPPDTPLCPPSPATVSGTITPEDVVGPANQGIAPMEFAELIRAIRAGVTYVNVHSSMFPGGEIRAQLTNQQHRDDRDDH